MFDKSKRFKEVCQLLLSLIVGLVDSCLIFIRVFINLISVFVFILPRGLNFEECYT